MSKDPTPKADGLRAMREARFAASKPKKLVPYAGKDNTLPGAGAPTKKPKVKK